MLLLMLDTIYKSTFPSSGGLVAKFGQFGAVHCHGDGGVCSTAERTLVGSKQNRCDYWRFIIWLHWHHGPCWIALSSQGIPLCWEEEEDCCFWDGGCITHRFTPWAGCFTTTTTSLQCCSTPWYQVANPGYFGHCHMTVCCCRLRFFSLFTGITLDILLKSSDVILRPPYCDWLQKFGQIVLLFSVFYRYVGKHTYKWQFNYSDLVILSFSPLRFKNNSQV